MPSSHTARLTLTFTQYGATLVVDIAHDLGAIGPDGTGHLGLQGMLGKVDVVMGSFSKTFASNGGFVATNHPAIKLALRYNCGPLTFTNAITPIAASIVRECLAIVQSADGAARREQLLRNSVHLRMGMAAAGFEVLGQPSAIVPVILGNGALSRLMTKHALRLDGIISLVEYPAVSKNTCRWRLQVMAQHTGTQIDEFIGIAVEARRLANAELAAMLAAFRLEVLAIAAFFALQCVAVWQFGAWAGQGAAWFIAEWLACIALPFYVWNSTMAFVTIQLHTHPNVRWYDNEADWSVFAGQVEGTVHVTWPLWFDLAFHNIFQHTAHHADKHVPLYNLRESQRALSAAFPAAVTAQKGSVHNLIAVLKTCRLYDYRAHRWIGWDGEYTSDASANEMSPSKTPRTQTPQGAKPTPL